MTGATIMSVGWNRASKSKPCPICGATKWCSVHESPKWAKCMSFGELDTPITPGYVWDGETKDGGNRWNPSDAKPAKRRSAAELDEQAKQEQQRKAKRIKRAREIWKRADSTTSHPRLVAYLKHRGIDVDKLPSGNVPQSLRYLEDCEVTWSKESRDWIRRPAMVAKQLDADATFESVHRTFLDPDGDDKAAPPGCDAKMMLGPSSGKFVVLGRAYKPGILIVCEGIETGLAILAAVGNRAAVWSCLNAHGLQAIRLPSQRFAPGKADGMHTIIVAADTDASGTGAKSAGICENVIASRYPWLTVRTSQPDATCSSLCEFEGSSAKPKEGKSVDWLDVYNADGADAVRHALLDGVDSEANLRRAYEFKPGEHRAEQSTPESTSAPTDDELVEQAVVFIEDGALRRGRRYLLERYSLDSEARKGKTFTLRRYRSRFFEWTGTHHVHRPDELLFASVFDWLDRFHTEGKRGKPVPLDPSPSDVNDVLKALLVDTQVVGDETPTWVPASFDDMGRPLWGVAAPEAGRCKATKPRADMLMSFANGVLDLGRLISTGEVRLYKHDPRYFTLSSLPYDIDFDRLEQVVADESKLAGHLEQLAPATVRFLSSSFTDEKAVACLQEIVGVLASPITILERVFLFVGMGGAGKGTVSRIIEAVVGTDNVAPTSFGKMGGDERFHLSTLVGKPVAMMPDAQAGKWTDMSVAIETIKQISGRDPVLIEWKNVRETATMRLPCRFVIFVNDVPKFDDDSGAFINRLVPLPLPRAFRDNDARSDKLKDQIATEGPGIALWAIVGLLRIMRRVAQREAEIAERGASEIDGYIFTKPDNVPQFVRDVRRSTSWVAAFAEDCLTAESVEGTTAEPSVECDDCYAAMIGWCHESGEDRTSKQTLGTKLRSVHPQLETKQHTTGARARYYAGVRLTPRGLELVERGRAILEERETSTSSSTGSGDELPVASEASSSAGSGDLPADPWPDEGSS